MKMLMIIADAKDKDDLEVLLGRAGVVGYTEISPVSGVGATGPRLGSGAFPRSSAIVLTMLENGAVDAVVRGVDELDSTDRERTHLFAWDVEPLR